MKYKATTLFVESFVCIFCTLYFLCDIAIFQKFFTCTCLEEINFSIFNVYHFLFLPVQIFIYRFSSNNLRKQFLLLKKKKKKNPTLNHKISNFIFQNNSFLNSKNLKYVFRFQKRNEKYLKLYFLSE